MQSKASTKPSTIADFEREIANKSYHAVPFVIDAILAREMLKRNTRNRKLRKRYVQFLKAEMDAGRWIENSGEKMSFDYNGVLIDGQHRLEMIALGDRTISVVIVFGADPKARLVTDTNQVKTTQDIFEINGYEDLGRGAGGIARLILTGARQFHNRISPYRSIQGAEKIRTGIKFCATHFCKPLQRINIAPVKAAIVRAFYAYPQRRDDLKRFCEILITGITGFPRRERDVIAFRNRLLGMHSVRNGPEVRGAYLLAEAALLNYFEDIQVSRLRSATTELFPFPWESSSQSEEGLTDFLFPVLGGAGKSEESIRKILLTKEIRADKNAVIRAGSRICFISSTGLTVGHATVDSVEQKPRFHVDTTPTLIKFTPVIHKASVRLTQATFKGMDLRQRCSSFVSVKRCIHPLTERDFMLLTKGAV